MSDKPTFQCGTPERKVVYAWEGEVDGLRAEIRRLRVALMGSRQFINDWGPDEPGHMAELTNGRLKLIDDAMKE